MRFTTFYTNSYIKMTTFDILMCKFSQKKLRDMEIIYTNKSHTLVTKRFHLLFKNIILTIFFLFFYFFFQNGTISAFCFFAFVETENFCYVTHCRVRIAAFFYNNPKIRKQHNAYILT